MLRRRGLQYVLAAGLAAIFVSAGLVYLLERGDGGTIDDYGTALWWAVTTITTVGYGDTFPTSAEGRGVAMFLMLVGISFFSWVTANISAFLVEHAGSEARSVTMDDLMAKLEALETELRALREQAPIEIEKRL
jgi:voltage-gated potassium channel